MDFGVAAEGQAGGSLAGFTEGSGAAMLVARLAAAKFAAWVVPRLRADLPLVLVRADLYLRPRYPFGWAHLFWHCVDDGAGFWVFGLIRGKHHLNPESELCLLYFDST